MTKDRSWRQRIIDIIVLSNSAAKMYASEQSMARQSPACCVDRCKLLSLSVIRVASASAISGCRLRLQLRVELSLSRRLDTRVELRIRSVSGLDFALACVETALRYFRVLKALSTLPSLKSGSRKLSLPDPSGLPRVCGSNGCWNATLTK